MSKTALNPPLSIAIAVPAKTDVPGALLELCRNELHQTPMKETKSTCCYCGVGCGVVIEGQRERIIAVRGDADHPANFGRLCTKGTTLHLSRHAASPNKLL